jgi:lipid-A-disaccharide synthase
MVAGEASGDQHGAGLVSATRSLTREVDFIAVGGEALRRAGAEVIHDASEITVVGISEVFERLPAIRSVMRDLVARLRADPPDALLLIDFPDFNLRLARKAHALGVPIVYFISPQVWAWREGRVQLIRRIVRRMIVLFRFEQEFYRSRGVNAVYVGHPVVELYPAGAANAQAVRAEAGVRPGAPLYGLLPGSREGELRRHLPLLVETARLVVEEQPGAGFVLPVAETLDETRVQSELEGTGLPIVARRGSFRALAGACDAAIAASGTVTLELAMLGVPAVVVYRTSWPTWVIGRLVVRVPHVSLVNLVAERRLIPELLQSEFTPRRACDELLALGQGGARRDSVLSGLAEVRERLGEPGAYRRAAAALLGVLDGGPNERGQSGT